MGVIDLGKRISAIEKKLEQGGGGADPTVIDQLEAAVTALEENATPARTEVTELTNGTSYTNFGGVYYEKLGALVHVHVSVSGLTANTNTTIFTMPEALRPTGASCMAVGIAQQYFADAIALCKGGIGMTDGNVFIVSSGTYAVIDFYYILVPTT